ncbi:MAG: L-threonylcarbamoyladenylate synthase [Patescibacteria group bacterium]
MKLLKITNVNFQSAVQKAVVVLKKGGVVAHPTDTVWGLAADFSNAKAIKKVHAIKQTDPNKPFLIQLPSKSWLIRLGQKLCVAHALAKEFWPGPLALIVRSKKSPPNPLFTKEGGLSGSFTLGVRYPDHKLSNALARGCGFPLVTTSANIAEHSPARSAAEVEKIFAKQKSQPDLVLDDPSPSAGSPSTIVDVSGKEIRLIREGTLTFKKILRTLARRS